MTPERVEEIVEEAIRDMVGNPLFTPYTIAMVAKHLRATLAPLVNVDSESEPCQ